MTLYPSGINFESGPDNVTCPNLSIDISEAQNRILSIIFRGSTSQIMQCKCNAIN
jgi:hypothetical protein